MQNNSDPDDDGWQIARGSGRGKSKRNGPVIPPPSATPIDTTPPTQAQLSRHLQLIQDSKNEILASQFYKGLLHHAFSSTITSSSITEIIVYGLGSLQAASGALQVRYQLALATLLLDIINSPSTSSSNNNTISCKAYDPIFTPLDTAILQAHNIQVIEINEHGRRKAHGKTFFFMPHCESSLTEALLQANVEAGTLSNVVILGNAFSLYVERWSMSSSSSRRETYNGTVKRPDLLLELCERGVVEEIGIPEAGFPVMSAFSSLALHTFKANQ